MIAKIKTAAIKQINKYKFSSYIFELQKTFNEDKGPNKVAFITYYMFLSVLPLLLVSLTIFDIVFASNPDLRKSLVESTFSSIPVVGATLESNLTFVQSRGVTLLVTVTLLIWASRSGAVALQDALNQIFKKDLSQKSFVVQQLSAFSALVIISLGSVVPTFIQSAFDRTVFLDLVFFVLNICWNTLILFLLIWVLVDKYSAKGLGTIAGGVGLSLVQVLSVLILRNSLDNQRPLYGTLAIVLVFIAWISLQIRVIIYSAEVNKINSEKSG